MRKYRAEQIVKAWKIIHKWIPKNRRLWKYLWKNRGELIYGKDDD